MSNAALQWQDHGPMTLGYHWYTAPAARGFYIINPTFARGDLNQVEFVGYHVAQHVARSVNLRALKHCNTAARPLRGWAKRGTAAKLLTCDEADRTR